jgi:hypothetical protein
VSLYPQHPRIVVTRPDPWAAELVAKACAHASESTQKHPQSKPVEVDLYDVLLTRWGREHGWRHAGYAFELCQWEVGERNRRPSSFHLNQAISKTEAKVTLCNEAHRIFQHWLALVDAAVAQGVTLAPGRWGASEKFGAFTPELLLSLQAADLSARRVICAGGETVSKRPNEERPELTPLYDDELGSLIAAACDKQRALPLHSLTNATTVADCLYLPITDAFAHVEHLSHVPYAIERMKWLLGQKKRRPHWSDSADRVLMRRLDDVITRLVRHWLAIHVALSMDGKISYADLDATIFDERLLLTDVEKVANRADWESRIETQQVIREHKHQRSRISPLAA